jgi:hypothetical protein
MVPVGISGERGHLRDETHDLLPTIGRIIDVLRFRIEGRERADTADDHAHGVGVVSEALEQISDVLVHIGVERDFVHETVELGLGRQLAVQQ